MADTRTPAQRSRIMAAVGTKDTGPELAVRRALHRLGYRFRLHRRDLPGRPDIVFPSRRLVIFVHGCYWHGHGCSNGRPPKSNESYWGPKIDENRARDARNAAALDSLGWTVRTIWQCELKDAARLDSYLDRLVGSVRKVRSTSETGMGRLAAQGRQAVAKK